MSTRSNIIIKNGRTEILLYRHSDGYLTETGQDLHDDLSNSDFDNVNGYFNLAKFTKKLLDQEQIIELIINLVEILSIYTLLSLKMDTNTETIIIELN